MPLERFAAVLANAPPSDALILQGIGEPTLHPGLPGMIDMAKSAGKFSVISFNTNALVRKYDYYARLKTRGLGHISISVDSLDPITAEALRGGTDCEKLKKAIAELSPLFDNAITLSIVLSRRNAPELSTLLPKLYELGGRVIEIQPLIAYADEMDAIALSAAELRTVRASVERLKADLPGLNVMFAAAMTPTGERCSRPFRAGYVTVGGYMTPCCTTNDESLFGRASLVEQTFESAWRSEGVQAWLADFAKQDAAICLGCTFNPVGEAAPTLQRVTEAPSLEHAKALQLTGQLEAAEIQFRAVLAGGDVAEALQGLGLTRFQRGDALGAVDLLRAALALKQDARTIYNTAYILAQLGRRAEAIMLLRPLPQANPDYSPAYLLLSSLLEAEGDHDGAAEAAAAGLNQALTVSDRAFIERAVSALAPLGWDSPRLIDLANRLRTRGLSDQAALLLEGRLSRAPDDLGARLALAMARLVIVHESEDEIVRRRAAYSHEIDQLATQVKAASPEALAAGARAVGDSKPFYLSYQGGDDRSLQQVYGGAITRMMDQATRSLPPPLKRVGGGRLKVGFATGYFHTHSVSKLFGGWIRHLDRTRFEVFGYDLSQAEDALSRELSAACDGFRRGFRHHQHAFEAIAADDLDVLIYPEIGMHPVAVQLACRRLAPVQCVAWGHPVTTGLPNIDYFLSSDLMEPEGAEAAYTETLVRLPNLSIHYDPLPSPGGMVNRADLGLREDAVVYVCCQSMFKYLPRYDEVFAQIAARVPTSQFLFIGDLGDTVAHAVHARLSTVFTNAGLDPARHLAFTKPVPAEAFPSLLRAGDVYLDSIGWSGGNTTLEAVTCDLPVVTLPTNLMRGRHSAAILWMMGIQEAVVDSEAAYVDLAVHLADPAARAAARQLVVDNKHRLFGDLEPVRALEAVLIQAAEKAASSHANLKRAYG